MRHLAENGSDGFVVAGTTGEASTLTDEEQLGLIELAVARAPAGHDDHRRHRHQRHAPRRVYLTERATELGADAILSVTPYYNKPSRLGLERHYEAVARATDKPILLYNIPGRTGTNMPPDLLAELAQIDGIEGVKQANADELQLIDGLALYAGDDATFARTLDIGGAGGILVASHIVGDEMRRMVDEPERRAEIDAVAARRVRDAVPDLQPDVHEGRAEPARPRRRRRCACRSSRPTAEETDAVRAMLERHGLLAEPPAARDAPA